MAQSGLGCKERLQLEGLIHGCVTSMAYSSASAARMTQDAYLVNDAMLYMLRDEYAVKGVRLETLRECLANHVMLHGCVG